MRLVRYKARLVAQGFTQKPDIDYDEIYSPVMSGITFRYLISLAMQMNLYIQLMDVVPAARSVNMVNSVRFIRLYGKYGFNTSVNTVTYKNTIRFR
jgi:hypothetical protein